MYKTTPFPDARDEEEEGDGERGGHGAHDEERQREPARHVQGVPDGGTCGQVKAASSYTHGDLLTQHVAQSQEHLVGGGDDGGAVGEDGHQDADHGRGARGRRHALQGPGMSSDENLTTQTSGFKPGALK